MPIYSCKSCNFSTKLKGNYSQHLKTKKHLNNVKIYNNYDNEIIHNTINIKTIKMNPNESFLNPNESFLNHNESFLNPNESYLNPNESFLNPNESYLNPNESYLNHIESSNKKNNNSKKYICNFCQNSYTTSSNLHRHLKKCKLSNEENLLSTIKDLEESHKKELEKQREKISLMEKEKEEMKSQIDILLTKVGDTTNITNNTIVLNCYGNENLNHITDSFKTDLLKIPYGMIPKLIEAIHFNKNCPENKNILLPNKKATYVKVYQGNEWKYKDRKETIKELVDKNYSILDAHYESKNKVLDNIHKERYVEFKDKLSQNNNIDKKVNNDVDLLLINN